MEMIKYIGTFHYTKNGNAYVTVNNDGNEFNLAVIASYSEGIFEGDKVEVVTQDSARGCRVMQDKTISWGKITNVAERAYDYVIGEYNVTNRKEYVMPESYVPFRIQVKSPDDGVKCRKGDKVAAEINKYKAVSAIRVTPIVNFGAADTYGANYRALIYKTPYFQKFDQAAEKQAASSERINALNYINKRVDLRAASVFTIADSAFNCNGFGFSITKGDGEWRLGVHVIDAAEYIKPGTPIDQAAFERGRSVSGGINESPIMPRSFIDEYCTFGKSREQLAVSTFVTFDQDGNITDTEFCESVISPVLVATADDVDALVSGSDHSAVLSLRKRYMPIIEHIGNLFELAGVLRQKRLSNGGVDFDMCRRVFSADGEKIRNIALSLDGDSSLMVAELLAACGTAAAEKMHFSGISCVYTGLSEKSYGFATGMPEDRFFLPEQDYRHPGYTKREAYAVRGTGFEKYCFADITEECMSPNLSFEPAPHYLYKSERYVEYFHPAEKYSDIINLRAIKAYLNDQVFDVNKHEKALRNEEKACELRRKLLKIMTISYLNNTKGRVLEGCAIKTAPDGMYVILDCGVWGLLNNLPEGNTVTIGSRVRTVVENADYTTGKIILSLA